MKMMKKIVASLVAVSTLAVGMTGINVSASTASNWQLYQPEGYGKTSQSGYVTDLRPNVDI